MSLREVWATLSLKQRIARTVAGLSLAAYLAGVISVLGADALLILGVGTVTLAAYWVIVNW